METGDGVNGSAGHGAVLPGDWRYKLIKYIRDPNSVGDRNVRRQSLKYTLVDNELYRRTVDGLLLKCLGEEQAKVAMGEVHEGRL